MKKLGILDLISALNGKGHKKNKKGKLPGSNKNRFVPSYTTLKVVPRSKRTQNNSTDYGIHKKVE